MYTLLKYNVYPNKKIFWYISCKLHFHKDFVLLKAISKKYNDNNKRLTKECYDTSGQTVYPSVLYNSIIRIHAKRTKKLPNIISFQDTTHNWKQDVPRIKMWNLLICYKNIRKIVRKERNSIKKTHWLWILNLNIETTL